MIVYLIAFFFAAVVSKSQYAGYIKSIDAPVKRKKLKTSAILSISILFVLMNVVVTNLSIGYGVDRTNYYLDFMGRKVEWLGLEVVLSIFRLFTSEYRHVLYFTTFICVLISLYVYRNDEDATPETLIFFLATYFVYATLDNLKQCYANALAVVFFCQMMRERSLKRDLLCLLIALLASYFHAVGFLLFILFAFFRIQEYRPKYTPLYILMVALVVVFFEPVALYLAKLIGNSIPLLAGKIYEYFDAGSDSRESINAVFLKGLPAYLLSAWGVLKRKRLSKTVRNYDAYLFLTVLASFLHLYSARVYWLVRFPMMLFYPMGMLFSILYRNSIPHNRYILGPLTIAGTLAITLRSLFLLFFNFGGL